MFSVISRFLGLCNVYRDSDIVLPQGVLIHPSSQLVATATILLSEHAPKDLRSEIKVESREAIFMMMEIVMDLRLNTL